jgi:phosphorylated adapter RNA export protein
MPNNNVWSNVLVEEDLCETVAKLNKSQDGDSYRSDRGVESYEIDDKNRIKFQNQNHLNLNPKLINNLIPLNTNKDFSIHSVKDRLTQISTYDETKKRDHIKATQYDTDAKVTKEIMFILNEERDNVISKCVQVLGRRKALEILYATEDILDNGGMLTADGFRHRTPGGVYFFLVRRDESILNCQRKQIFIDEAIFKKQKKKEKRKRYLYSIQLLIIIFKFLNISKFFKSET